MQQKCSCNGMGAIVCRYHHAEYDAYNDYSDYCGIYRSAWLKIIVNLLHGSNIFCDFFANTDSGYDATK